MLERLAEAESGIDDQTLARNACARCRVDPLRKIVADFGYDIVVVRLAPASSAARRACA